MLLTLLDRQVELKQDMIEEARTEVAAARARILAAKEEGWLIYRVYVCVINSLVVATFSLQLGNY